MTMRAQHTAHNLDGFPVYSSAFLTDDLVVLGGGGGSSKSGVKNKLRLYNVKDWRKLDLLNEFEFDVGEDAPMSMAIDSSTSTLVCGVNSAEKFIAQGQNDNCRVFEIKDNSFSLTSKFGTLGTDEEEDYQKVTVISPDGNYIIVTGSNTLQLLSYPSLSKLANTMKVPSEIYSASFSSDSTTFAVATSSTLFIFPIPKVVQKPSTRKQKGKLKVSSLPDLQPSKEIKPPEEVGGPSGSSFRAVVFHPKEAGVLYTGMNSSPKRTRTSKVATRTASICRWSTSSWNVTTWKKVGDKGLTCMTISLDARYLGIAVSDLSVSLLDTKTLSPLVTIMQAHTFPATTLAFSPTTKYLLSGSPDSVRIAVVPDIVSTSWGIFALIFFSILLIFIAIMFQRS